MIKTQTVFVTSDNLHFFTAKEAEEHEKELQIEGTVNEFVAELSKSSQIKQYMARAIIAWETKK